MDEVNASTLILENEKTADVTETNDITDSGKLASLQDSQPSVSTLTQRVLHYLTTADNGTLVIIIVTLVFVIYIVFGRLGLLLIGLVTGFLFHEFWDGVALNDLRHGERLPNQVRKRKELGIEVASRLLDWNLRTGSVKRDDDAEVSRKNNRNFADFRPATAAALTQLTDALLKDYVTYWYQPILPSEETFPLSCRDILVNFINSLSLHMTRKRSADTFLQFVTNSSSMIIVFLDELSSALETASPDSSATEDVIRNYLKQYPESNLSNVLSIDQQQKKLKMVADDVLSGFLEPSVYKCEPLKIFFREIFAGVVLESVIKSCSQPDFINGWIVYLLQEGEPEILNAIDAGLENAPKGKAVSTEAPGDSPGPLLGDVPTPLQSIEASEISRVKAKSTGNVSLEAVFPAEGSTTATINKNSAPEMNSEAIEAEIPTQEELSEGSSSNEGSEFVAIESPERGLGETKSSHEQEDPAMLAHTLFGASVLIDDGSLPGDKAVMKAKPTIEYSLQIEPVSARQPGWMIFRSYQDFEYLHEGLSTLSRYHNISFLDRHASLPTWRGRTKYALAKALEKYLQDVLQYRDLVGSERVKRFFGRDSDLKQAFSATGKAGLRTSNTFENMGKGMLGVLSNAPKGVTGGGRAVLDGVTGVFASVGLNKKGAMMTPKQSTVSQTHLDHQRYASQDNLERANPPIIVNKLETNRSSTDQPITEPMGTVPSLPSTISSENSTNMSTENNVAESTQETGSVMTDPPTDIEKVTSEHNTNRDHDHAVERDQRISEDSQGSEKKRTNVISGSSGDPITEDETRVAVELIFAVINELYTLSSAWNIRRTLLNAAKTYILRPGNPHLESIRVLVQQSMIDAHTSDEAIATNVSKMRENALPTEEELKLWPPPLSEEESAKLKANARKLLIERGMPQALMSVMGAAATGEALAKVFDCLQIEEVARGFMFALILQALRAIIL